MGAGGQSIPVLRGKAGQPQDAISQSDFLRPLLPPRLSWHSYHLGGNESIPRWLGWLPGLILDSVTTGRDPSFKELQSLLPGSPLPGVPRHLFYCCSERIEEGRNSVFPFSLHTFLSAEVSFLPWGSHCHTEAGTSTAPLLICKIEPLFVLQLHHQINMSKCLIVSCFAIHLFDKCILNLYCVPGIVLDFENTSVEKNTSKSTCPHGPHILAN